MTGKESARRDLRTATAADHDAVDRAFGRYDLSSRQDYADFLEAQAAAFVPVEAAIDAADTSLVGDWPRRRRAELLRADLAALGRADPIGGAAAIDLPSAHAVLGAVYVLEGSRLGGTMLARRVPAHLPQTFLAAGNSALWRSLLTILEKELVTDDQRGTAIAAARTVFALFEKGANCRRNPLL